MTQRVEQAVRMVTITLLLTAGAATAGATASDTASPTATSGWRQVEDPSQAGWSRERLEEARRVAEGNGSAAALVVEDGVVIAAWGQVDRPFPIYSMRKSLYGALVGMMVEEGKIDLEATLEELGITDVEPLTEVERSATVADLVASRSGVYHPSAYEPASMKRSRPARGSHAPGEHWFYNNWDFNLVAHLIEEASGRELAKLFDERLAVPLGMEDFSTGDVFSFLEPSHSRFPAAIFRMSARDLARVGQLYLDGGLWRGERLLPAAWVAASSKPQTVFPPGSPFGAGNGFGHLWWHYPARAEGDRPSARHDILLTRGSGGQVLAVLPELRLVVVRQTASGQGDFADAVELIDALVLARRGAAEAPTVALAPQPLGEPSPAPERRTAVTLSRRMIDAFTGDYALTPDISFRVHELDGRLFALPRGAPLAEVELFVDAEGIVFSPAVDLALEVVRDEGGEIVALEGRMEGRPVRLQRSPRPD